MKELKVMNNMWHSFRARHECLTIQAQKRASYVEGRRRRIIESIMKVVRKIEITEMFKLTWEREKSKVKKWSLLKEGLDERLKGEAGAYSGKRGSKKLTVE